jgi:hypothetical protein
MKKSDLRRAVNFTLTRRSNASAYALREMTVVKERLLDLLLTPWRYRPFEIRRVQSNEYSAL